MVQTKVKPLTTKECCTMKSDVKKMIQDHFSTERGKRQLERGPYRDTWRNAAMSVALLSAANK